MPNKGTIGKIKVEGDHDIEWKIPDFFSNTKEDDFYQSPHFTASEYQWYLQIVSAGRTDKNSVDWISLYLQRSDAVIRGANYSFGIKKGDGTIEKKGEDNCWLFDGDTGFGTHTFLKKSDLLQRKAEWVPSDVLTIACTLWVCDSLDSTSRRNTLSNRLLDMFTSKKASDVTLQVKGEYFDAHKFILIARSPVFAAMFDVPMKESATGVVDIDDFDPQVFKEFLVFLYSGRLEKRSSHLFELYKIAHKYEVRELRLSCVIGIMKNLSEETFCDVAILADMYNETALKDRVENHLTDRFSKIFLTSHWEELLLSKPLFANKLLKKMARHFEKK